MTVNFNLLKSNLEDLLNNSQSFSFEEWDKREIEMGGNFKETIKELYVNNRLKEEHPIMSFFSDKPIIGKICSKYIKSKKNIYVDEFENNPKIGGFRNLDKVTNFIRTKCSSEFNKRDKNYRKLELMLYLYIKCLSLMKNNIQTDDLSKDYTIIKEFSNIQMTFKKDNLKEFLQNKSTTKNDIEKILLLFKSEINYEFLEAQINNLNKIKEEQENLPEKEKDYNLYANILYLKAIIYFNFYKNKEKYLNESKELFSAEKFYRNLNFCLKKEDILDFIKENCLKPRALYKKIKKLNDFSQKYDEEKGDTFYILYNNINNIEKEINKKAPKEVIAGLKFFKGVILELMEPGQDQQLQLNSKIEYNKAIKCYNDIILDNNVSEDKLKKAQIACLTSINITDKITAKQTKIESNNEVNNIEEDKNPFVKHFNNIIVNFNRLKDNINSLMNEEANKVYNIEEIVNINGLYATLSELDDKDAQYECGIYQENLNNQKIAINHFEIASIIGNDKAKFKTIKYYLNNNLRRNEYVERKILNSDISYKVCEKIAKIYKKNDEYETAVKFYSKINKKLKDKKNTKIGKINNIFVKIGNCFLKLCYKFRKSAENMICEDNIKKEEEKANYYHKQAIDSYNKVTDVTLNSYYMVIRANFFNNTNVVDSISKLESITKNLTEENLSRKSKSYKKKYKEIFMDLAYFYNYGFNRDEYSDSINYKKALEYYKKAAYLGDINSMWEAGMLLKNGGIFFTSKGDFSVYENKKEAFEYFKKILLSNDNYFKNSAIIEITEIMLTDNEVREQNIDEIFELFEQLEDQKTKFKIAKMLINSPLEEENMEEKVIKMFENLINNSNNDVIDKNVSLKLGNIFYERQKNKKGSYKENLENCEKYYLYYLQQQNIETEEKEMIIQYLEEVTFKLEALDFEDQANRIEMAKIKKEPEAIEIFKDLIQNSEIKQIKFNALVSLGNIYSERKNVKDLEYAKNCYTDAKNIYPDRVDEFEYLDNNILCIKNKINNIKPEIDLKDVFTKLYKDISSINITKNSIFAKK